jgi:hypothetical protein
MLHQREAVMAIKRPSKGEVRNRTNRSRQPPLRHVDVRALQQMVPGCISEATQCRVRERQAMGERRDCTF